MSVKAIAWAWEQDVPTSSDKLVLLALADHADDLGVCWPGKKGIAEKTGISDRTVNRSVDRLEESGLLVMEERFDPRGRQTSNRYRLLMGGCHAVTLPPDTVTPSGGDMVTPSYSEPSEEPSEEGVLALPGIDAPQSSNGKVPPLPDSYTDDFEELWRLHRRGPKSKAFEWYWKARHRHHVSHEHLVTTLRLYVKHEVEDDFKGAHLFRWLRDQRWEEQEHRLGEVKEMKVSGSTGARWTS